MLSGFLPINKPPNSTSAQVVARVKKVTKVKKVGHAGTLDPSATGVLVVAFNRCTRLFPFLLSRKIYRAKICLGITTDTLDAQGKVKTEKEVPKISRSEISAYLKKFQGKILQQPPLVSALHYKGKRLYQLARQGQQPEIPSRIVNIYKIDFLEYTLPYFEIVVTCSPGTYIRTLADDLGKAIGCGAHLYALERLACSGFELAQSVDLEKIMIAGNSEYWQSKVIPPLEALAHLPTKEVASQTCLAVRHGQNISCSEPGLLNNSYIKIINEEKKLLAIAEKVNNSCKMKYVFYPANEV